MDVEKLHKIDALVAEKVMGWKSAEIISGDDAWIDDKKQFQCFKNWWHPSTNIADAWKVVEKLYKTKGLRMFIGLQFPPLVMARVMDDVGDWIGHGVDEETAPLAICLAALEAVGVKVE